MFVRIITEVDGASFESVHECRNVKIHPALDSENVVIFEMIDVAYKAEYHIEKKAGNEVYLMNNRGQTIDTYRWGDKTPKVDPVRN